MQVQSQAGRGRLTLSLVPVRDRRGVPYEAVLRVDLDGEPFAEVGQRCAHLVSDLAAACRAAGPGRLPAGLAEEGVRGAARRAGEDADDAWARLAPFLPREQDLLVLRARDPDDPALPGELRVQARTSRSWSAGAWQEATTAVLEVWDGSGDGVRAVLTPATLQALLDEALAGWADPGGTDPTGRTAGG